MIKAKSKSLSNKPKKPQTKFAKLLARKQGATLDQMMKATGWQKPTVRAALSGLRRMGHEIMRTTSDGASIYRIVVSEQ